MFGDSKSVVDSPMQVHAKMHKRHTILSFHGMREATASGKFIKGYINPIDTLSKHWGEYLQIWSQLKAILLWYQDIGDSHFEQKGSDNFHTGLEPNHVGNEVPKHTKNTGPKHVTDLVPKHV
jgi:hypothetical protein